METIYKVIGNELSSSFIERENFLLENLSKVDTGLFDRYEISDGETATLGDLYSTLPKLTREEFDKIPLEELVIDDDSYKTAFELHLVSLSEMNYQSRYGDKRINEFRYSDWNSNSIGIPLFAFKSELSESKGLNFKHDYYCRINKSNISERVSYKYYFNGYCFMFDRPSFDINKYYGGDNPSDKDYHIRKIIRNMLFKVDETKITKDDMYYKYSIEDAKNKFNDNKDYFTEIGINSIDELLRESIGRKLKCYNFTIRSVYPSFRKAPPRRGVPFFALFNPIRRKAMFVLADPNAPRFIPNFKEIMLDIIGHERVHQEQSLRKGIVDYELPSPLDRKSYFSNKEEVMAFSYTIANGLSKTNRSLETAMKDLDTQGNDNFRGMGMRPAEHKMLWNDIKRYCDEKTVKRYRKYIYMYLENIFDGVEEVKSDVSPFKELDTKAKLISTDNEVTPTNIQSFGKFDKKYKYESPEDLEKIGFKKMSQEDRVKIIHDVLDNSTNPSKFMGYFSPEDMEAVKKANNYHKNRDISQSIRR